MTRNVAALRNFQCNVCLRKTKTLCRHSLNFYQDGLRSTQKKAGSGQRRAELRRSARRQQFIIKVSSWRFYNQQEEFLNQQSLRVIDRSVFNNLAVNNAGRKEENTHIGSMIFLFFLLVSKTDKPLGDNTYQNQSVKLICWQAFSFMWFFNCFFLFSFQAEIFDAFSFANANDEFPSTLH